jgi:hypothetical protein
MKDKIIAAFNNSSGEHIVPRRVSVTELDRDLTYTGVVDSINELDGQTEVSLINVEVFEYSSAFPLYNVSNIRLSRPTNALFIEELNEAVISSVTKRNAV